MKNLWGLFFSFMLSSTAWAEEPILIIGASYANASTPFNDDLNAPLGGISVGFGSYLSLGNGLVRNRLLSGFVINEAQAGATTFDRQACNPICTPDVIWQSYDKQLTKALARVTSVNSQTGELDINAKYVVISGGNDCLHSDAFGIPQDEAQPCTTIEFNELADRLISLGQRIVDLGLTPVFLKDPAWDDMDLPFFSQAFGLLWAINKADHEQMGQIQQDRITAELPNAVVLNVWSRFDHIGDGIHPDSHSVEHAARHIARFIKQRERTLTDR